MIFLQETHLSHESNIKLHSNNFPTWYYSDTITKRARGMVIGFAKGIQFKMEESLFDPEGRFLFLKGKLSEMECTLANIYAPNKNPIKYLKCILEKLMDFKSGCVILMGDMNVCMEPGVDSTSRVQGTNNAQLKMIRQKLHVCQMVDIWRIKNPKTQDFVLLPCT